MTNEKAPKSSTPATGGAPLLDVTRQHDPLRAEIMAAMERVLVSGKFVMGPDCDALERSLATYCQVDHAVACASGSDALLLALMAFDIGPGDEVILPSYTFFATASAVWRLGARPVMVDIEPKTFNINPKLLERAVTARTKAIIPVHLYGQCADMGEIGEFARHHRLAVIEDVAQAIGAEIGGRRAGSIGDIGCLSFYPTKNLGCLGDGGMLTTRDAVLADKLRLLRAHGMRPRYYHQVVGINSRLDTLQAAVLNVKLPHLERWTAMRGVNAQRYTDLITARGLTSLITPPTAVAGRRHVWNQYIVRVAGSHRDTLRDWLTSRQVGTEIYYPVPLDQQECFRSLGYPPGALKESQRAADETMALPIFPELTAVEQERVVAAIAEYFASRPTSPTAIGSPKFAGTTPSAALSGRR